mgnify:CR=1 FL=1
MTLDDFRGRVPGVGDVARWFTKAREAAHISNHHIRVGAVITLRSVIVGAGCNSLTKTHPEFRGQYISGLHAEMQATVGARRHLFEGAVAWVYREKRDGSIGLARPCPACYNALNRVGVEKCIYTQPDSPVGYEIMRIG